MDALIQDLRLAFRSLGRNPAMTMAAILTLALGIGANTAMFGVIDSLFFRPPAHVVDPDQVVRVNASPGSIRNWPRYADLRDHAKSLTVTAYFGPRPYSLGQGATAREVQATLVTADFFPILGVTPRLGRFFSADEDRPGSADVVVVSEEYWKRQLDGASDALGKTLKLGQRNYSVIGVAPDRFAGVELTRPDLWLPMGASAPTALWAEVLTCERCSWLQMIGRLAPGATATKAETEITTLFRGHVVQPIDSATRVSLTGLKRSLGIDAARGVQLSTWLAAACGIVLLIACVNVANLLLTRATRRQREMAVRMALGSRRAHLVRQLYLESGMLAFLGGGAALIMTIWVGPILRALLLPNTPADPVDFRVLLFTSAAALVTTMLAGLAPVLYATSPNLATALKAGAREGGGTRSLIQSALLIGQVALTMILLTGAALFVRSLNRVHGLRLGFEPEHVLVANANLTPVRPTTAESDAEYQRMRERVARVPGVVSTALSVGFPFQFSYGTGFSSPGVDSIPDMSGPYISAVSPEYFATMGTRVLRGRGITEADIGGTPRIIVVSELMARTIWPGKEPIGQCLSISTADAPCREVVGIVEDGRQDRVTEPSAQSFIPLAQADDPSLAVPITSLVIRTSGSAERMVGAVRQAIQSSAADLPFVNLEPMEYLFADQVRPWKLGASLFGLFGALALLLGAVGVYGVLSYAMSQRTHELGVRMTLGAQREQLLAMVVGRGVRIALFGVVIGAGGALLAGKALASLVYGISPYDPLNLVIVGLIMVLVAALASLIPAYRVSRIDPMVALRTE